MTGSYRYILLTCCLLVLNACGDGRDKEVNQNNSSGQGSNPTAPTTDQNPDAGNNSILPTTPVVIKKPLTNIPVTNGTLPLDVSFGSGAFHANTDPVNVFYTVTDRGPVIPCNDSEAFFGKKKLCKDNNGKVFLIPDYTPTIYKISLNKNNTTQVTTATIMETTPISDSNGNTITGITNPLKSASTEKAYTQEGSRIPFDASGIDPEAIIRLSNGTFWVADEYAPSLLHIASNGNIISRIVPASLDDDLVDATYPIQVGIPKILRERALNRGIEALAVSRNETQLFLMLQSPLANPKNATFERSQNVRIIRFLLDADGNLGNATGEFVYTLDKASAFLFQGGEPAQSAIVVSDMSALNNDELLILERTKDVTKIYKIILTAATNILETPLDDTKTDPTLEETRQLNDLGVTPVTKELIYSSLTDTGSTPVSGKIEGMALLDDTHILLINDNDFGINNQTTQIQIVTTPEKLF